MAWREKSGNGRREKEGVSGGEREGGWKERVKERERRTEMEGESEGEKGREEWRWKERVKGE